MIIDVMINSCARIDLLERSLESFNKYVHSEEHTFRRVLIEDKVDNERRRQLGIDWIIKNKHEFDKIVLLPEKAGVGFWWQKTMEYCESPYHIHVEDDNEYLTEVNIDAIIDTMERHSNIINIAFSRGPIRKENNLGQEIVDGLALTKFRLMSVAAGVFNTNNVNVLLDKVGWENKIHEAGTLTPASEKLKFRKYVLGHGTKHYAHVGEAKEYRKGGWIDGK